MKAIAGLLIGSSVLLVSCIDRDNFSEIPKIKYEEMQQQGTSIILKISFTDGDGDIGLKEKETNFPFGPCDKFYYNLFIDPYYMQDGEYVKGYILDRDSKCHSMPPPYDTAYYPDTTGYYYRVIYLVPEGKDKTLQGDISVDLNQVLLEFPGDTIKFRVKLVDRALHQSNVVETEAVITP